MNEHQLFEKQYPTRVEPEKPSPELVSPYFADRSALEVVEAVTSALKNSPDLRGRRWAFQELRLAEDASDVDIRRAVFARAELYLARFEELKTVLPEKLATLDQWLHKEDLVPSQPANQVAVVLYDSLFSILNPEDQRVSQGALFHPRFNNIIITSEVSNSDLAHELGHASAYEQSKERCGWNQLTERGMPAQGKDNQWLDEGCTMLIEFSTQQESSPESWKERNSHYFLFYTLTQTLKEQVGYSTHDLIQAYLRSGPEREELEKRVKERYGYSIHDLSDIILGDSEEWQQKTVNMLLGNPVELSVMAGDPMEEKYRQIDSLFPNVHLIVQ